MPRNLFGEKIPYPVLDYSAPFWRGDNANQVLRKRLAERQRAAELKAASRRGPGTTRIYSEPANLSDAEKLIRRIERSIPKRKTLVARQRLELRLAELRQKVEAGVL